MVTTLDYLIITPTWAKCSPLLCAMVTTLDYLIITPTWAKCSPLLCAMVTTLDYLIITPTWAKCSPLLCAMVTTLDYLIITPTWAKCSPLLCAMVTTLDYLIITPTWAKCSPLLCAMVTTLDYLIITPTWAKCSPLLCAMVTTLDYLIITPTWAKFSPLLCALVTAIIACILWAWLFAGSRNRFALAQTGDMEVQIRISRPRVFENPPQFKGFVNTPIDFLVTARVMYAHACDRQLSAVMSTGNVTFTWIIRPRDTSRMSESRINTTSCHLRWQAPFEGDFQMFLEIAVNRSHSDSGSVVATGSRDFFIKDIWVVAMGDSFASGQGNPDAPSKLMGIVPARWISDSCYRSAYGSWAFRTYKYIEQAYRNHGILFTYVACSGATIGDGILGPGGQLDMVASIQSTANRNLCGAGNRCPSPIRPDIVLMSIGGNDIFYSDIVSAIVSGNYGNIFRQLPFRFKILETKLSEMAHAVKHKLQGLLPRAVFYPHYFDISHNERGEIDGSCKDLQSASSDNFSRASKQVLDKINVMISRISRQQNWTAVERISDIFNRHGICSKNSFIRTVKESYSIQGDCYGAFHPNRAGHSQVARKVWSEVRPFLRNSLN